MDLANLSPPEAVWIALSLVTLVVHVNLLRETLRDKAAVALANGLGRLLVSGANVRREAVAVAKQGIYLFLGLFLGLFVPRALLEAVNVGLAVVIGGLIAQQALGLWVSIRDTQDRRTLLEMAKRLVRAGPLRYREVDGAILIESAPGEPTPTVKREGGEVVTAPVSDEPPVKP